MASYVIAIYSPTDVAFAATAVPGEYTLTVVGLPTMVAVNDVDPGADAHIFDDGNPTILVNPQDAAPVNQTFSATIDGTTYINSTINPEFEMALNGGPGTFFGIYDNDPNLLGGVLIGYGFTFAPVPGVPYTFVPGAASTIAVPHIPYSGIYVCFTSGTDILTKNGDVKIDDLSEGDMVWTQGSGYQPVKWIGYKKVASSGAAAPVRIKKGSFGASRDLLVSQQHRMVVSGMDVELLFGTKTALVAAKHLVDGKNVTLDRSLDEVEYYHILFQKHEIVSANGALSESFYPGDVGVGALENEQRDEVLALFPELAENQAGSNLAHPSLRSYEARALLSYV